MEIQANLRLLLQSHDPLVVTFHERSQRFQSFLVEVDKDRKRIALDEMVPNDGERFIRAGSTSAWKASMMASESPGNAASPCR